jgi:hypothetical protein
LNVGIIGAITTWLSANHETIAAFSAIVSLVFAAALVYFTRVLARKTSGLFAETALLREAAAEQSDKMSASILEAARAASAMETVAKTMDNNARVQLRAYVGARMARVVSHDNGSTFEVEVEIFNAGQTPARGVTHCLAAELQILHGEPLSFAMPEKDSGELPMVPGMAFFLRKPIAIGGPSGTGTIDNRQSAKDNFRVGPRRLFRHFWRSSAL